MKFCAKCQIETERYADGKCKPCTRAHATSWRAANPERAKANAAAWAKANHKRKKATTSAWNAANKERNKATAAAWKDANPERNKAINAAWAKANRDAKRIHVQNRSARKRDNGGTLSKGLTAKLFKLQRGKCACCSLPLGANFDLDHNLPLALGGSNSDDNMQLLTATCNRQKHTKHPVDFMQSRGFLL